MRSVVAPIFVGFLLAVGSSGCQSKDEMKYKPSPVSTAAKPVLPAVPTIATNFKEGEAFTVYGATHHLKSRIHSKDVTSKEITIVGTIVSENISSADTCAWHKTGKADPEDCKTDIPTFAIADDAAADPGGTKPRIRVIGWASNFANVFEAFNAYRGKKEAPKEPVADELNGKQIPFPLPAVGARVKVTGTYDFGSSGKVSDPVNGVMTYAKLELLTPAPAEVEAPQAPPGTSAGTSPGKSVGKPAGKKK